MRGRVYREWLTRQLVVPLFTDIKPQGGGTFIAPDSIGKIAGYLADHPEGVMPTGFDFRGIRDSCTQFVELTGNVGDVSHHFIDGHYADQSESGIMMNGSRS